MWLIPYSIPVSVSPYITGFLRGVDHLAAGCKAPLLAPPPRRQPPLRHVRPVPEAAVPARTRRGASVVGASVRSNVGMKTDKKWYLYAQKSNPELIYLLCSFQSLFLMWVILVQAASVTLGFTFQGSWQPEMTPMWNVDLQNIKHCLWLSTTIDQDKCPSCSLHSPHKISLLCWVR